MRKIVINRQLVPMKAHYFLWNAGTGPVVPFLSSYARQLGFSSVIVGLIYTILPISGMLAKPLFGAIADRFHCQKKIFLFAQLLTAVAFLAIFYSPQVPVDREVQFACSDGVSVFNTYPGNTADECTILQLQNTDATDDCRMECAMTDDIWTIICNDWNATQYCDPSTHTSTLDFTARVPKSKTDIFNQTVIFRIDDVVLTGGSTVRPTCTNTSISTSCSIECNDYNINDLIAAPAIPDQEVYGLYQFWVFLVLMVIGLGGPGDRRQYRGCHLLRVTRYGYQRLFGALGWGTISALAGVMIDLFSSGRSQKNYVSAFYMAAAFLVLDFVVSSRLEYKQQKLSSNILRDVGKLLVDIRIIVYLVWCICVGMCTGLIWQFLFWLIEDLAKAQGCETVSLVKTLQGLVMAIQCLGGELPFFFLSGWILKKIGHVYTMSLVLLVLGLRLSLYSILTNPWWILPIEFSNGLTFGLFFACMASYASIVAPPGTEATMQGLVGAVFEGVGVSLGSFLAGLSYNLYGGTTFLYFGIGSLIACVFHFCVQYSIKTKGNEKPINP
ncbi:hypothetical protein NQ317_004361 [Molorchus minor]|uniref:Major facilitator superfamily associated domain-containing protein n=1 Tax=Molorchus minor TaxID=1323400 RepID=A0ABQ9ITU8_9CUCU|nr:hypothetical protein NQ317_004361 [Molorchus minor]